MSDQPLWQPSQERIEQANLTRFARDLKHLMSQLDRLDAYALTQQRAITVPLLRRMIDEEGGP